ncbi:cysteine hydrolase family protein [Ancylobacter oerskovii]|uniref:Cysteine hydrolase family protein n=1 Tax=Ancylobacter oerskovii TaxID=459519 RepID=A0ABW4Z267_9HYPH|nr:cysteine hydrolase [Ancylobacter oerskovii]
MTVHLCIDMQKLFAPTGPWPTPWMAQALPNIAAVAELMRERSVFTRFIPAREAAEEIGTWRAYWRRWSGLTLEALDPRILELVDELRELAPAERVVDKTRFSAFAAPRLAPVLNGMRAGTLVITGAETDVCVLATVMDAVDRGYRVIVVEDAVCSSSDAGHDAALAIFRRRFAAQIETLSTTALPDHLARQGREY